MSTRGASKLVLGFTSPGSIPLIRGQMRYFVEQGFTVYLMCPFTPEVVAFCRDEGGHHIAVPIKRTLTFFGDIKALLVIRKELKQIQPDIVNVGTPKMGLLGMMAAYVTGVKLRIYTCRGLAYQLKTGFYSKILRGIEIISASLAHKVVCVGPALMKKAIDDGVFRKDKCVVIAKGGSNGVDISRFDRSALSAHEREETRSKLRLVSTFVFGFVGRMVDRKGVKELYEAFDEIYRVHPSVRLLWVGTIEVGQLTDTTLPEKVKNHPGIRYVGWQDNVPLYMSIMDVFVIPSWWEGFGNVHIQAAAMGLPVITTDGVGCIDAVNDGFNGSVVAINDKESLKQAMLNYFNDAEVRLQHGRNGINWSRNFMSVNIWEGLLNLYVQNLARTRHESTVDY